MNEIEVATKLENHEGRIKELENKVTKFDKLQEQISALTTNVEKLYVTVKEVNKKAEESKEKIETIEKEPGNKWRSMTMTVITGVVAFLVAFILGQIF